MSLTHLSSDAEPVKFFEYFIDKEVLLKFENQFYYPSNPSMEINRAEGYISYINDVYENEEVKPIKEYFKDFLLKKLSTESNKTIEIVANRKLKLEYYGNKDSDYYANQINKIESLKPRIVGYEFEGVILEVLGKISNELQKYLKNSDMSIQIIEQSINDETYFELKDFLRMKHLKELYELSVDLNIFDISTSNENSFLNVFSTQFPSRTHETLKFDCNNQLMSLFFQTIQPFFNNLSHSRISNSKLFFNKQGNLIDQNMLDISKTRLEKNQNKYLREQSKLKEYISGILS